MKLVLFSNQDLTSLEHLVVDKFSQIKTINYTNHHQIYNNTNTKSNYSNNTNSDSNSNNSNNIFGN